MDIKTAIDAFAEKMGVIVDWGSENVLPYVQDLMGRFIKYDLAVHIVWLVVGILLILLSIFLCVIAFKKDVFDFFIFPVVGLVVGGVPMIFINLDIVFKCIYIPEGRFIEYISKLI